MKANSTKLVQTLSAQKTPFTKAKIVWSSLYGGVNPDGGWRSFIDADGTFGARGNCLADQILQLGRDVRRLDVGVSVVVAEEEYPGRREGAERVALADVRIDVHLHDYFPFIGSPTRGRTAWTPSRQ